MRVIVIAGRLALSAAMLTTVAAAAPPLTPPFPASAASQARAPVGPSPAVKAAEQAREPGQLRPEQPVIPQISVPLARNKGAKDAPPPAKRKAVDDQAARCGAQESATERAKCLRSPDPSPAGASAR